ncbi:hypothetical protein B566_EDAN006597, partial [Ephemera danica]
MLVWHTENCHGNNPTVKVVKIDDNKQHFQCIFCKTEFREQSQIISHLLFKHQLAKLPYQCKVCNKQYTRNRNLRNHEAICGRNQIFINNIRPVQVENLNHLAANLEQPVEEISITKVDVEEHEIKPETEDQLHCLPQNTEILEQPMEEVLITKIDIEEHEIKLESEDQLHFLPQNA